MACLGISAQQKVRVVVLADLVIALVYTIYRITSLSLLLKRVVEAEKGKRDPEFDDAEPETLTIMKFSSVFLITAGVLGLAMELFLFFLLNNGARSKNYRHCKHWFIIRILLLMLSTLGSVIERVRGQYKLIDCFLEIEKFYRIVELLVVRSFMKEIYKGMSDNNDQYNNSGACGDGYPNGGASTNIRSHSNL